MEFQDTVSPSTTQFKKALIVGSSRGLGNGLSRYIGEHHPSLGHLYLVSRKQASEIRDLQLSSNTHISTSQLDMSKTQDQDELARLIAIENFDLIIYSAGGGPHGDYVAKEWKDHHWSLQVNLLAPMRLTHAWLAARQILQDESPGRFVIVGSRIAESTADPHSATYAAGKHGVLGFVSSIQPELENNLNKVWLFSPGYMDTDLLPRTAKVRHDGSKLMNVDTAAQALLRWLKKDGPWHRVLN